MESNDEITISKQNLRAAYILLALLSMFLLIQVVRAIMTNSKLQQHPLTLIAAICTVEAILSWQAII